MKICILQKNTVWASPERNISEINSYLQEIFANNAGRGSQSVCDLVILPEMFSTGFCPDPEGIAEVLIAESNSCKSLDWMRDSAQKYQCALCGSIAIKENDKYYNRLYFVFPNGEYKFYNKRHLFSYSGEDKHFNKGEERVVVEYKGMRFCLQICYDLRFPAFCRNSIIEDSHIEPQVSINDDSTSLLKTYAYNRNSTLTTYIYSYDTISLLENASDKEQFLYDAIIYVAAWPESRIDVWNRLLPARAIENQSFVIGVNNVGIDANGTLYNGCSAIYDYFGDTIDCCNAIGREEYKIVEIDKNALDKFRKKFPALKDAD